MRKSGKTLLLIHLIDLKTNANRINQYQIVIKYEI
jgi:hypothetical protein